MTSFFKVDTELFLLIAFRLFQGFSGLHKPKKAKCHTSDAPSQSYCIETQTVKPGIALGSLTV